MRIVLTAVLASALLAQAEAPGSRGVLAQADAALQAGEADHALALLQPLTAKQEQHSDAKEIAQAHNLTCRVYYILEQWDRAAGECEQAVKMDGGSSNYHLWLGRALGGKAEHASFLSAYALGKRVKSEFEEAVRLDPRNAEALADLGEFYYQAPGIVGGGEDKAEGVARQLDPIDPIRANELRAHIAEEHKDYSAAERQIKAAVAASNRPAFQWMGLASFYRRHQRWAEMEAAVLSGLHAAEHDRRAGVALYGGASVLIRAGRNTPLAAKMMESYLAGPVKTEEAPAFVAHLELARLKDQLGDPAAAERERSAAHALAHEYRLAQDSKH